MELISAKLHPSFGSFPSSASLSGFLNSEDGVSPIKTYPVYASNNSITILDEKYEIMHQIHVDSSIKCITCHHNKIALCTKNKVEIIQKYGTEFRTLCILEESDVSNLCFFLNGNGICIATKNKLTLYSTEDLMNRYHHELDEEDANNKKQQQTHYQTLYASDDDDEESEQMDDDLMQIMDDMEALVVRSRCICIESDSYVFMSASLHSLHWPHTTNRKRMENMLSFNDEHKFILVYCTN